MEHFYKKDFPFPHFPKCLFLPVTGQVTFSRYFIQTLSLFECFFLPGAKAGKYCLFSSSVWCPGRGGCLCVGVHSTVTQPVFSGIAILSDFSSYPPFCLCSSGHSQPSTTSLILDNSLSFCHGLVLSDSAAGGF